MTAKEYYSLFTDYGQHIRQKDFNINACNPGRLNRLKKQIVKEVANSTSAIDRRLKTIQKENDKSGKVIDEIEKNELLTKRDALLTLIAKVKEEKPLASEEYRNTFYEPPKTGLFSRLFL
jgi:hypothetical protein